MTPMLIEGSIVNAGEEAARSPRRARCVMRRTGLSVVALWTCLLGPTLPAQDDRDLGEPVADSGTVERVDVRVVRLSVLGTDGDGRPLTVVRPEDLGVTLDGRDLEIAGFHREIATDEGDRPEVTLRIEVGRDATVRTTAGGSPRYWLLFIDTDNDLPGKQRKLAEAIGDFIEKTVPPSDFVAVASYDGRFHVEQQFSTGKHDATSAVTAAFAHPRTSGVSTGNRLRALVNRMEDCAFVPTPAESTPPSDAGYTTTPGAEPVDVTCLAQAAVAYIEEMRSRSDRYYGALERSVRLAATVPRGPIILAVSHGVTVSPKREFLDAIRAFYGESQVSALESYLPDDQSAAAALDSVMELARLEGVVIYFVDPAKKTGSVRGARQERIYLGQADPGSTAWAAAQTDLRNLAEATGGLLAAAPDRVTALDEFVAREDARLILDVYVPGPLDRDEIRRIAVRPRGGGIRIASSRLELEPRVPGNLQASGGVQLGSLEPREGEQPGGIQPFLLGVRQKQMDYAREGDDMVADLSLHVRVETDDGRNLVDSPHVFRHSFPLDKWDSVGDATLAVRGSLEAPPGNYRIVAEFRNIKTRKTGWIEQEIHIP